MKKIPTLFVRDFTLSPRLVMPELTKGCEWVLQGTGLMTIKIDGCCMKVEKDKDNVLRLKRRLVPSTSDDTDATFVPCNRDDPMDKALYAAYDACPQLLPGIYEAFGPEINGNHQNTTKAGMVKIAPVDAQLIVSPGETKVRRGAGVTVEGFFNSLRQELLESEVEGFVFVLENPNMNPVAWAKIRRKDYGFAWPIR